MIYIVYFIVLLILINAEAHRKNPNNYLRWVIPIIYILFIGLRGANVGMDTPVYYRHYYMFGQWGCDFVEVGFDWLNQFCFHRGWSHVPFFCICAALTVLPVVYAVSKITDRSQYSFFMLLFCFTTFSSLCNGMRQNIACSILFVTVIFIQNYQGKKLYAIIVYLLGITLAALFHYSVLLAIPIYFAKYIRMPNRWYLALYILSFLFVFTNITEYIPDISFGMKDYSGYKTSVLMNTSASSLGFIVSSLRNFLILLLMFRVGAFKNSPMLANMAFLMFVFSNIGFNVPMVGRISMYFSFFFILFEAIVFSDFVRGRLYQVKGITILVIAITIVMTVHGITSSSNKLTPYTFYWENIEYEKFIDE